MGLLCPATFKILPCRWELFSRRWKTLKGFLLSTIWDSGCNLTTEFHAWVEVSGVLHQVHFGFEDSHKGDWGFITSIRSLFVYRFCVKKLIWIARVESLWCPWSHVSNALPSVETRSKWSPIILCIPTFSVPEDWIPLAAAFQPIVSHMSYTYLFMFQVLLSALLSQHTLLTLTRLHVHGCVSLK